MSRRTIVLFAAISILAIALSACGGGAAGSNTSGAAALNVTITGTEFKFDPATINATPGQTINVTLKNTGSVEHTLVFAPANFKMLVQPGKSDTKSFTAPTAPGTYDIVCDVAGHKEAGMVGKLVVK
ncbi:MAG: cupredoxin domain-containing protein [Chloroflexi bacterium]|nr:cupredoxin domain-containing protein [Chloroflexota bacterium]